MRKFIPLLAAAFLLGGFAGPTRAADAGVSIDFFYNALEPQGEWIEAADYGYVWHPNGVGEDWRPYTDGRWVYTDAGWTWDSDEPYGWAVYHYGRWARLESAGWVWVPDVEWGPAWVSWRRSEKHIGWAPLPPEARFQRTVGISKWADSYYDIGPANYSFVESRSFGSRRLRDVIVEPRQNVTIVTQTTNITNITYRGNVIVNEGPQYDVVVRESAEPIQRLRIERRTDVVYDPEGIRGDRYRNRVEGGSFQVIAPTVQVVATAAPHRIARTVQQVHVNRGWTDAGDQHQVEQLRAKVKAEAKPPAGLPPQPKFDRKALAADAQQNAAAPTATMKPGNQPATAPAGAPGATATAGDTAPTPAATPAKGKKGAKAAAAAAAATAAPDANTPPTGAPAATPRNAKNRKGAPAGAPGTAPATAADATEAKPDATMKPTARPDAPKSPTESPDAAAKPESATPAPRKRGANASGENAPGAKRSAQPNGADSTGPGTPPAPATPPPTRARRGAAEATARPTAEPGKPAAESAKPAHSEGDDSHGRNGRPSPKTRAERMPAEQPSNPPASARESTAPSPDTNRSPANRPPAEHRGGQRESASPAASGAAPGASHSPAGAPATPAGKGGGKGKGKAPTEPTELGAPAPGQ